MESQGALQIRNTENSKDTRLQEPQQEIKNTEGVSVDMIRDLSEQKNRK